MDRYKIALGKVSTDHSNGKTFRFAATHSVERTLKYIEFCVKRKADFVADNISASILETALIKVSRATGVPIVVKSKKRANILQTVYSYDKIVSRDSFEDTEDFPTYLIYYDCPLVKYSKTYLKVFLAAELDKT